MVADSSGIGFTWTGYNGVTYTTDKMSWDDYKANNYSVQAKALYSDPKFYAYVSTLSYDVSPNLSGLMDMLTDGNGTPGLLTSDNVGCSNTGGSATMYFNLKSGSSSIGSMTMGIQINKNDTEQTVLNKIQDAFNTNTVLDMYTTDSDEKSTTGCFTYPAKERTNKIDVPVYQATNILQIQAGSESGQYISIYYDALSTYILKLSNTKVDTVENAEKAIDEVKNAMQVVNAQRADFGAYQNRLEHTYRNLDNVVENTTAESQIRDTDMAKAMVQQAMMDVLEHAGASMLAQANQTPQGVLQLLG